MDGELLKSSEVFSDELSLAELKVNSIFMFGPLQFCLPKSGDKKVC